MTQVLLVGSGGFLGAVLRYAVGGLVHRQLTFATFPFGTLTVNLVGCFVIGAVAGLAEARQVLGPEARLFVLIGLLGGFTTYSTFAFETYAMLRDGEILRAALNVGVHVVFGLTLVWLGYALTSRWTP